MMQITSVRVAVLLICLMVFAPISHCRVLLQNKKNSLVEQTCNKVGHDVNLCITSLNRIPESAHADVKGLAFIMAKDVLYGARNSTVNKIQGLLKQSPGVGLGLKPEKPGPNRKKPGPNRKKPGFIM